MATPNILIMDHEPIIDSPTFEFKGGSYTITTFQLLEYNLKVIDKQLKEKINTNWNFFHKAPIVIDLKALKANSSAVNLDILVELLLKNDLIPVAVINANLELQHAALECNLALLHNYTLDKKITKILQGKKTTKNSSSPINTVEKETINPPYTPTLITERVRSGQQIYAQGGDLIVTSSVSNGAELLADGNIHVYGTLSGRALAGVNGNQGARIFCQKLDAELVSIAGQYMICEDIEKIIWNKPAQIRIINENLHIEAL